MENNTNSTSYPKVGAYDAKTKLPEILRRVQLGEAFTITNRGKAIADLVPSRFKRQKNIKTAIENLLKKKKRTLSDKRLKAYKEEGRK